MSNFQKNYKIILKRLFYALSLGLAFVIMSFFFGIVIGGNFGFPALRGFEPGYESAGIFFGRIGLIGGVLVTLWYMIKGYKLAPK